MNPSDWRGPKPRVDRTYFLQDGTTLRVVFRTKREGPPYVVWPRDRARHPLAGYRGYVPVLKLAALDEGLASAEDLLARLVVVPIDGDAWNWNPLNLRVLRRRDFFRNLRATHHP